MKQLLGLVIGITAGFGTILGVLFIGQNVSLPPDCLPPGLDTLEGVTTIGAWTLGALVGGVAAVRIGNWPASGWIIVLLATGFAITQVLIHPHPLSMQIAAVVAPLLAGVVVSGIARPA
ncbi:hypothetical protein HNP52_001087 [Sphingomonas kyeonggiensis]|uniref:Uncharacterized protein n=1 Tax=Sphingomonas kyeonggiensis TaxID=1268553 RepID=A0A7W7NRR4_9SPHN|nr:hypothetical protein [Sphingomonas kyeonggiensis]MBB4838036.1 hypothetical protein [Sphingomonas kyeonggiensis]